MLDVNYSEVMIAKAQAIVAEAMKVPKGDRDTYCQGRCGLTFDYLRRIGASFKQPSNRTLMNLGYELCIRDVATGEITKLEMNIKCDWNPANPRMNPVSMPVSVNPPTEDSISSA